MQLAEKDKLVVKMDAMQALFSESATSHTAERRCTLRHLPQGELTGHMSCLLTAIVPEAGAEY
jgi:hypothetical protein